MTEAWLKMIVETTDEELHEVSFVSPDIPGTQLLSVTFTEADRTEFQKSAWSKVTRFEDACRKYLLLIV